MKIPNYRFSRIAKIFQAGVKQQKQNLFFFFKLILHYVVLISSPAFLYFRRRCFKRREHRHIKQCWLRWIGHIERMESLMQGEITGTRRTGKPRRELIQDQKEDLKKLKIRRKKKINTTEMYLKENFDNLAYLAYTWMSSLSLLIKANRKNPICNSPMVKFVQTEEKKH